MDFDKYQYTGFLALAKIKPDWDQDTFNREQIELYIKKRLETKTYNQFYEVDFMKLMPRSSASSFSRV